MITEDYVSFETAKLLKEKGFDELCDKKYYGDDGSGPSYIRERWEDGGDVSPMSNSNLDDGSKYADISTPTLQMAMKWLREVHNLCLFVIPATIDKTFRTGYALYPQCDSKWEWCASKNDRSKATFGFDISGKYCDSYEEAVEEAIKYCLENLI